MLYLGRVLDFKMRICLEKAGIPNPRFEIITNLDQAEEAADKIGYPCVVKPTDQVLKTREINDNFV
jgi:cysteine synthase A